MKWSQVLILSLSGSAIATPKWIGGSRDVDTAGSPQAAGAAQNAAAPQGAAAANNAASPQAMASSDNASSPQAMGSSTIADTLTLPGGNGNIDIPLVAVAPLKSAAALPGAVTGATPYSTITNAVNVLATSVGQDLQAIVRCPSSLHVLIE